MEKRTKRSFLDKYNELKEENAMLWRMVDFYRSQLLNQPKCYNRILQKSKPDYETETH